MSNETKITAFMNTYVLGASGGDVRFIETFKRMKGVNVTVVTPKQGLAFMKERGLTARSVLTVDDDSSTNPMLSYPVRILGAWNRLRKERDLGIIYGSSDLLPDTLPAVLLRRRGTRYVQVVHHLIPAPRERQGGLINNTIAYLMQRLSLHLVKMSADLVIVVSPLTEQNLIGMGFEESRLFMNPNGVDSVYFDSIAPGPIRYDATFLGRLHVSKGIYDAIRVWKEVCKDHPGAKLAMIGPGVPRVIQAMKDEIRKEHMEDNIDVLGYLERDSAFQLVKSSKVFIFPSHEEGFGIAILEAMACEVPVVAWDLPVYRDIFQKGLVATPLGDIQALSENVLGLLDDEGRRKRMGEDAKALSMNYDWNKISAIEEEKITSCPPR